MNRQHELRVLLTGAAGFIGSHTAEELIKHDCRVLGLDSLRTGRLSNLDSLYTNPRFSFEEVDVLSPAILEQTRKFKPQVVIHLAALVSVQESIADPDLNFRLNLFGTHCVAEAARHCGAKRLVFASSAAVYGNTEQLALAESSRTAPVSPYGAAKLASESLLLGYGQAFGLTVRCQRYFNVYGPRQDPTSPYSGVVSIFSKRFADNRAVAIFGLGDQSRDFIYVKDVARANVFAAINDNLVSGVANICTGESVSLNQLIEVFRGRFPNAPQTEYVAARRGDILHSLGDPRRAEMELSFRAAMPLKEGLMKLIEHEAIRLHR